MKPILLAAACRILLVPGAFGAGTSSMFLKADDYFSEYRKFFESKGCFVKKAELPPNGTIEERAMVLKDQVMRFRTPVVIAHSQGALDARFALRTLGLNSVDALITIGAPHSGTAVADWAVQQRERESLTYWALRIFANYDLRELPFAAEMTPGFLEKFGPRFTRMPGVKYASAQGVCRTECHRSLRFFGWWAGRPVSSEVGVEHGDGIVGRASQSWGDDLGEYDLDHISEVGVDPAKRQERERLLTRIWKYLNG